MSVRKYYTSGASLLISKFFVVKDRDIVTARKRSLGQGNVFRSICLSTGGGGVSVQGVSVRGVSVRRVSVQGHLCPGRPHPPPSMVKSGRYASYWNAFMFLQRR